MSRNPRSHTNRSWSSISRNCPIIFIPTASWLSTSSRSKRSMRTSRLPGCRVYWRSSTTDDEIDEGNAEHLGPAAHRRPSCFGARWRRVPAVLSGLAGAPGTATAAPEDRVRAGHAVAGYRARIADIADRAESDGAARHVATNVKGPVGRREDDVAVQRRPRLDPRELEGAAVHAAVRPGPGSRQNDRGRRLGCGRGGRRGGSRARGG